ncbi:MAG: hypothetical protein M1820_009039 [Bogoriella megaspora]|nr:MAG: hypothetical protein M1820_009039 [Bogoriella megaspora]
MLFTLRLLPCTKTWAHRIIYLAFFLNFAITLIACVCYGVRCTPFRAAYEEVPGSHCKSDTLLIASQQANGILACIIDITTALIPAFLLWDLQMKKSTKTVLNSIFLLGLFTAGLSIGRAATTNKDTVGPDFPFTQTLPGIMSLVEVNMGMLFASCPVLRQLIAYIMRHGTMLPTKSRGPPNRDFIAMRKRITLRDIFWYRQSTPDEISPPPDAPPNKPREIPNTMIPVKLSAMDRVWRGLGRTFGVKRRDDLAQHHRTDSLSHSEKGLVGRGSGLLQESETSKESKKTFLLSASGNGSGIGWHLNSTTSADSSR